MNKNECLECGEILIGRRDKKYCNDNCRNTFHNRANSQNSLIIRETNNILKRNYRILLNLNPRDKTKTTKESLLKLGFSFQYFTSQYTTKKGTTYFFVYDQGYLLLEKGFVAIVKRKFH